MSIIETNFIKNFINIEKIDIKTKAGLHGICISIMWISFAIVALASWMKWTAVYQWTTGVFLVFFIFALATKKGDQKKSKSK